MRDSAGEGEVRVVRNKRGEKDRQRLSCSKEMERTEREKHRGNERSKGWRVATACICCAVKKEASSAIFLELRPLKNLTTPLSSR
jgi:hypothetical protein